MMSLWFAFVQAVTAEDVADVTGIYKTAIGGLSAAILTLTGWVVKLYGTIQKKDEELERMRSELSEVQEKRIRESAEHHRSIEALHEELLKRKRKTL